MIRKTDPGRFRHFFRGGILLDNDGLTIPLRRAYGIADALAGAMCISRNGSGIKLSLAALESMSIFPVFKSWR